MNALVTTAYRVGHAAPEAMQDMLRNVMAASVPRAMRATRLGSKTYFRQLLKVTL